MDSYVGEVRLFSFDRVPQGWLECNGQTLQVAEHASLFSMIGTKYGGNGMSTFCLPKLDSIGQSQGKVKFYISIDGEYPEF
jgi:microcystin-dependent protein